MSLSLDVKNLSISFGQHRVVHDVSFSVAPGETYGIVGESGSGKSTILRVLAGLHAEWSGELSLGEEPLQIRRPRAQILQLQMVFQDPYSSLHPRKTIDAILSEPLKIHGFPDIFNRVSRALEEVGLAPALRYRFPHQLSGGQRQRVAIARALIIEPKVVLLDEPTSALDVAVQADVLNLLSDLRQAQGLTYVMVSHDLGVVAHLCSRVAIMRHGRMDEELDLRHGFYPKNPYGRELLELSEGH